LGAPGLVSDDRPVDREVSSTSTVPSLKTVIRPPTRWPTLALHELWRYRSICMVLVRRSLMVRYRQTAVGATWAMLQPLLLMLVFTVFFGILANVQSEGIPYAVFVMIGLTIWQVVGKVLNEGSLSVVANGELVKKIYFPRVYFPIASALGSLVDLAFGFLALGGLLVIFRIVPGWTIVLVPVLVTIALAAVIGVSLWLAALNVTYRDIAQLLPFLTQVWMFTSPIFYSSSIIPAEFRPLYWLNPMVIAVDGLRWAIAGTSAPPIEEWIIGIVVAAILLCSGYVFFRQREPGFSDTV
jgi:ABC-type polysaccharide/polyol phosphate export systems, permease component